MEQIPENPSAVQPVTETYVATPRRARRLTREFSSISSIFGNDFLRSRTHRYGKLLRSRDPHKTTSKTKLTTARNINAGVASRTSLTEKETFHGEMSLIKSDPNGHLAPPDKQPHRGRASSPYVVPMLQDNNKAAAPKRIARRRILFNRRRKMCNVCVGLAVVGLMVMMVDMEITRWNYSANDWGYWLSMFLKLMVAVTTAGLVASIVAYHTIEIQIYLMETGADDWKVAMTARRTLLLVIEILICGICPLPGIDHVRLTYPDLVLQSMPSCNTDGGLIYQSQVPLNVLLSIPMFARSYLVCRIMVLHSKQFQDTTIWSIASFNHVTVNFKFVAKTLLSDHPLKVLVVSTVTACCCAAWMFTQCERYTYTCETEPCSSYSDSLWLVVITLLSVGYGDIVPHTYCGRFVSILTGIAGMGVSAALISVMTGKIGLTSSEKQVNSFVTDSKLASGKQNAAATVLQETWFIHKHKRNHSFASKFQVVRHQRKFLEAIHRFRNIKMAIRNSTEKQFELLDVRKVQQEVQETVQKMQNGQTQLVTDVNALSKNFADIQNSIDTEFHGSVAKIQQSQEYTMIEINGLQKNMESIQLQLACMADQLKEITCASHAENGIHKSDVSIIGRSHHCIGNGHVFDEQCEYEQD